MSLLSVRDLRTHFDTDQGVVRAVDGVSLAVERGQVLCVVGESGSGKSVACLSILGLVRSPPGRIVSGQVLFRSRPNDEPEDLLLVGERRLRAIRGDRIAMVFQDPMTSLNPYMRVGRQLCEVLELHQGLPRTAARERAADMLREVGIPAPEARLDDYPHQLSGGMRQRVMIAMALLCQPALLIADEPTTALDVTIQAQILALLAERKAALGLGVILITHDLGVVARLADRVAVMYAGRVVEQGGVEAVFERPLHPYTRALQRSIPRLDGDRGRQPLEAIAGMAPRAAAVPRGCPFHPRCTEALDRCREQIPAEQCLPADGEGSRSSRRVRCHLVAAEAGAGPGEGT